MSPKAYSSFFFQLPNVPHSAPPIPSVNVYAKAQRQQQFRGKSFLSLDNEDSIRDASIGEEQEGGKDGVHVDSDVEEDTDKDSVWTAFTKSSATSSSFVLAQGTYATRTRPVLAALNTRHQHQHHQHDHQRPSPSPFTSSHSPPQSKLTPISTVLPAPPVLPELPHTPSLSLPFDLDVNSAPSSVPETKTTHPTFHASPSKPKSTAVSTSAPAPVSAPAPATALPPTPPVSPSRLKPSLIAATPKAASRSKSKPVPIPTPVNEQSTLPRSKPKTSPQSTPLQPRRITAPQSRRQRPVSTSTVSTHYRMVKRAGALACLEGKRDAVEVGLGLGAGTGLVKSTIISAKSKSKLGEADVKSFMPLDDDSSDDDDDSDDEKDDVYVPVISVPVRRRRHRGTINSWFVGPAVGEEESRFSTPSESPVSSRSTSPPPSPSSSNMHMPYARDPLDRTHNVNINGAYNAASVSAKSSPMLASMKPSGNFIDLDFDGEGDVYEYPYWR